ncbi:MAG TPA: hypothetical protein VLF14_12210 [Candidatus Binatia bacterium]|nr:hypothetical protein [Candidatus Binatia bacterium]
MALASPDTIRVAIAEGILFPPVARAFLVFVEEVLVVVPPRPVLEDPVPREAHADDDAVAPVVVGLVFPQRVIAALNIEAIVGVATGAVLPQLVVIAASIESFVAVATGAVPPQLVVVALDLEALLDIADGRVPDQRVSVAPDLEAILAACYDPILDERPGSNHENAVKSCSRTGDRKAVLDQMVGE